MNYQYRVLVPLLIIFIALNSTSHAEWPTYRADSSRSGIAKESIDLPLARRWSRKSLQRPSPAWPDPVKERHRLDFDRAPQLIVAGRVVYFGSSTDDTLRALEADSGNLLWSFTTGGPIRFAPACVDGRVYVVSDDGYVYCLNAASGELFWKFHAADVKSQVLGNGRLISRRPLRSGVLVDSGIVYTTAGVWPSEGVLIYALDAVTGTIQWCNDTSDTRYLAQPHAKAYSLTGVSPQGYLLATDELLLVPTGRGVPAAFDREFGRLQYFKPSDSKTHGGCWATLSGDRLFNGGLVYDCPTGNQIACETTRTPLWAKRDFDFGTRQHILGYRGDRILANGDQVIGRRTGYCLALAGDVLLEGGEDTLAAFDTRSKHEASILWQANVSGQVRSIAISDGAVFISTSHGDVHCFAKGEPVGKAPDASESSNIPHGKPGSGAAISNITSQLNITAGYAVVVGDLALAESMARDGQFHILCLLQNESEVSVARKRLVTERVYGSQISVQNVRQLTEGHFPPYFANLIVIGGDSDSVVTRELWRILRPCGGVLCYRDDLSQRIERLTEQVEDAPSLRGVVDGLHWLQRGKLPGAFDWDSEVSSDQRVKWPMELAWFGGPGPARMQDRHQASVAPPIVANGRYFVSGERHIIAVDAYNGTELWSHQFAESVSDEKSKQLRLKGLAADDHRAYYQLHEEWVVLDAQTGKEFGTVEALPDGLHQWGRIAKRELPFATHLRTHSLTGENVPRTYFRAYGCNQIVASDGVDFFRSGTLGFYDLNDDSGLRNFGGIRPGCSRSHNPAFGVFLSSEGSSGCVCSYSFQTSLMLAPARTRSNEDWAVYHDLPAAGLVKRINVNLGAPGDRRDEAGRLWLGFPRPSQNVVMQLPVAVSGAQGKQSGPVPLGPYHFDADRRAIGKTKRPWIYTTGYRGLRKLTIGLDEQQPLVSQSVGLPPVIDGRMGSNEWSEQSQASLRPVHNRQNRGAPNRQMIDPERWASYVRLAHNSTHLFVAYQQPNRLDRRGLPYQWRKSTEGSDALIYRDDSFELFLSDSSRQTVLHFGVSASGATYEAKWESQDQRETAKWNGSWLAETSADDKAFVTEIAIPWSTLTDAGLSRQELMINAQANWAGWNSPLRFLGSRGRMACENFAPLGLDTSPNPPERQFTVSLHFSEPDLQKSGSRKFDVRLQGRTVLSGFDIHSEAGNIDTAVIKEFKGVIASSTLDIELSPVDATVGSDQETILSAVEIKEESKVSGRKP